MTVKYAELFAGVGGFRLGIEQSGLDAECVYASEVDKHACAVYRHIWRGNGELYEGDIREQGTNQVQDFDFLTAGFPCQSFSVAGKLGGFQDTRGTLFFEVARFLADKRPRHFLLENVKNLVGHDGGKTFQTILRILADIGYRVEWEVLNSKVWVPQNRERVFIIGHLRGTSRPQVFPLGEDDGVYSKASGQDPVANYLDANYWKGWLDKGQRTMVIQRPHGYNEGAVKEFPNLRAGGCSQHNEFITVVQKTSGQTVTVKEGETGTLQAGGANVRDKVPNVVVHENKSGTRTPHEEAQALRSGASHNYQTVNSLRRLTPVECERLQGWPDLHTAIGLYRSSDIPKSQRNGDEYTMQLVSDTQRYKMAGNGVTADVIREIIKKMMLVGCFE